MGVIPELHDGSKQSLNASYFWNNAGSRLQFVIHKSNTGTER